MELGHMFARKVYGLHLVGILNGPIRADPIGVSLSDSLLAAVSSDGLTPLDGSRNLDHVCT